MMKQKLTIPEQIQYMKSKGIKFELIDEKSAEDYITNDTYFFKIKAYAKNYEKYVTGIKKGNYINLDFACLKELSILDTHFRKFILHVTLNIEHSMKVELNRHFSNNPNEMGYTVVQDFMKRNENIAVSMKNKTKDTSSYIADLLSKYKDELALWNFIEMLSFGEFLSFYKYYFGIYEKEKPMLNFLFPVKCLRNAAAHNNCLLNNLKKSKYYDFSLNKDLNTKVSKIEGVGSVTRTKKMKIPVIHDFTAIMFVFNDVVKSCDIKEHISFEAKNLLDSFEKSIPLFKENDILISSIKFIEKILDNFEQ